MQYKSSICFASEAYIRADFNDVKIFSLEKISKKFWTQIPEMRGLCESIVRLRENLKVLDTGDFYEEIAAGCKIFFSHFSQIGEGIGCAPTHGSM